ncbi:MAG: RES domain-containing protein [Candidatus Eremiobacteraeota bacterium]|nr:RES domain-containing protein [Candidatus Eremiobacteraeota bacterium]
MRRITRGGTYLRVFKPDWNDPLDPNFSKTAGGRWNAPGAFGVVSLNATLVVAAGNARIQHRGRAIGLFDLRPARRPSLLQVHVPNSMTLDVISDRGIRDLRLPAQFPWNVPHERCRAIGLQAYRSRGVRGIASRSAAECTPREWLGEELAWFDSSPALHENGPRHSFATWYPDAIP